MARTRRENGAGTKPEQLENGRWRQLISYRDVETDELKRTTIRGATEKEVKAKVKDFLKTVAAGVKPNQKKITLYDWMLTWLEVNKKNVVSLATYNSYENIVMNHVKDTQLGKMQIDKIKRADIQKFINDKINELAVGSLKLIKMILSDALKVAELDNLIAKNPCKAIKLPKDKTEKVNPLNNEEITLLLDAAGAGTFIYTVIQFGLRTGARVGEIAGLTWDNVDFQAKIITICQQAKYGNRDGAKIHELGTCKTESSNRKIPLDVTLADVLRWHKRRQEKLAAEIGEGYNPLNLVFPSDDGKLMIPQTISERFSAIIAKLPIPKRSIHDLRHTFASVAISQGLSIRAASAILGHSKASITLDIYSHCMPGDEASIINAVSEFYCKKADTVVDTVSAKTSG